MDKQIVVCVIKHTHMHWSSNLQQRIELLIQQHG